MTQLKSLFANARKVAIVGAATVVASPAFAAMDTSEALTNIGDGVAAAILIGAAMLGLTVLIGAYKKTQRAGS